MGVNSRQALAVNQDTAAELLDVSVATLRRWRRRKQGPRAIRMGRLIRYTVTELERFLRRAEPAGSEAREV